MKRIKDWDIELLKFIAKWSFVDLRFLEIEYPNKGKSWLHRKLKNFEEYKILKSLKLPIKFNGVGAGIKIGFLTKAGFEEIEGYQDWSTDDIRFVALDHNLTCLKIVKALHVGKYNYGTEKQNEELAKRKQLESLHKSIVRRYREAKSVDFIYDKGNGKIAVEVELTMKATHRYIFSKGKKPSVFKKINRDYGRGMFKRLEGGVPRSLEYRLQRILGSKISGADHLTCPYEIKIIENLLPGGKRDNRYKFNLLRLKNR